MEAVNIICVLWKGSFRGRPYDEDWVLRLRNMVSNNLSYPFKFFCISNIDMSEVNYIKLKHNYPGWWSKVELFRQDLPLSGRCLYLDLDTLIVGDLDEIIEYPEKIAFHPPSYMVEGGRSVGGQGIVDGYNSSVIVFDYGVGKKFYNSFWPDNMKKFRGDQDWFAHIDPGLPLMPTKWFRKLKNCQDGPSAGVKVVLSMPFKNNVACEKFEWVKKLWV